MEPTTNDVLSGRGAWFNQHSGNRRFRKMLDERKNAYMTGTKKQKTDISNSIVEAILSMDPPGRFLRQCPETGQWSELSKRDATDKAAQAMAWVIRGESLKQKRRDRRSRLRNAPSFQSQNSSVNTKSPQSTDPPSDDNSMPPSSLVAHCDVLADTRGVELTEGTHHDEVEPTSNLHSQLPQQSSQSSATTIPTSEVRHRNEHIPLMPQSLYQQRLFSHPIQNTLGTQTQIGLLSPITLNQIKQQLFSRHLLSLNQHQTYNFPPASTLPPAIFASNSLFAGVGIPQSQSVQSNRLHNPLQQFFTPSFRSGISNNLQLQSNNLLAGLPNISWGQQQPDQSANLLMLQRNQLSVFSNNMFSNHCLQPHQPGLLSSPLNQLNQAQTAQSQLNTGDPSTTQILPTISSISNCGKSDPSLLSSEKKTQIKKRR